MLHMLSFLYARYIVPIRKDTTFDELKKSVKKGNVKLPVELEAFLKKYNLVNTSLVVITEIPKTKLSLSLGELSPMMEAKLKWFIPSEFFLRLLPKDTVDSLYEGTMDYFKLGPDIRNVNMPQATWTTCVIVYTTIATQDMMNHLEIEAHWSSPRLCEKNSKSMLPKSKLFFYALES